MKQMSCANCNATLTYEENDRVVTCNFCGTVCEAEDRKVIDVEFVEKTFVDVNKSFCNECGTRFISNINTIPQKCAYCGSSLTTDNENHKAIKPEKILIFEIGLDEAKEKTKKYFEKSAFEYKELAIDSLHPIYLPYWMYDCTCEAEYEYLRVASKHERHYLEKVKLDCQGVLVDDSSKIENKLTNKQYFNLYKLKCFDELYIDTFCVEENNVELNNTWRLNNILKEQVLEEQLGVSILAMYRKFDVSNVKATYIYLPFYYAQVNGLKVLVNGQSGDITINSKEYLKTEKQLAFKKFIYSDTVQKKAELIGCLGTVLILFLIVAIYFLGMLITWLGTMIQSKIPDIKVILSSLFFGGLFILLLYSGSTSKYEYSNIKKIIYKKKKKLHIWDEWK